VNSKKLQQTWYRKLKKAGFNDAEDGQGRLKEWHSHYFKAFNTPEEFEENRRFYVLASQLLHSHTFRSERDKRVWELFCNGVPQKDICKKVGIGLTTLKTTLSRYKVFIKQ
jgi:ATP/maltotriose-dependent transcriptional regulator MalT